MCSPGGRRRAIPDKATHGGVGTRGGSVESGGKSAHGSDDRHTAAQGTVHLMAGPRDRGHTVQGRRGKPGLHPEDDVEGECCVISNYSAQTRNRTVQGTFPSSQATDRSTRWSHPRTAALNRGHGCRV